MLAASLLIFGIVLNAHAWLATAACWRVHDDSVNSGGYTHSNAMASSYGLVGKSNRQKGSLDTMAQVGTGTGMVRNRDDFRFLHEQVYISSHATKKDVVSYARASATVKGWIVHDKGTANEWFEEKKSLAGDELPAKN